MKSVISIAFAALLASAAVASAEPIFNSAFANNSASQNSAFNGVLGTYTGSDVGSLTVGSVAGTETTAVDLDNVKIDAKSEALNSGAGNSQTNLVGVNLVGGGSLSASNEGALGINGLASTSGSTMLSAENKSSAYAKAFGAQANNKVTVVHSND